MTLLSLSFIVAAAGPVTDTSSNSLSAPENLEWPVYAAYASDSLKSRCEQSQCQLDILSQNSLAEAFDRISIRGDLNEALSLSQYEVLISSALIARSFDEHELVLEIATTWRGVPLDEYTVSEIFANTEIISELGQPTLKALESWGEYVQINKIFDAQRIYKQIGASDYSSQMHLPAQIGEFILHESALYHDPMQGSITRYSHPDFADAVVDVSVYPISPFEHPDQAQLIEQNSTRLIEEEMLVEIEDIQSLISQAKIKDFSISALEKRAFAVNNETVEALSLEVALETKIDPVYSTQILFKQQDKFIKLTGNLPKPMMLALAQSAIEEIEVPAESDFMRAMRN